MMGQPLFRTPLSAIPEAPPLLPVLDWHSLDTHSPLYPYFAHIYYGGGDLWLDKTEVTTFVRAFIVQAIHEGKEMEPFDLDEGFDALESESERPGFVRLLQLIEELGLLVV
ncbi:hypothetical protein ACHHYP_17445 [Achlya hypogyna]|uniref:Uncharacterized protein n=1 Tax=Achlya hypogyna TaxID=1202772 RepID=A0A1V9Y4F9_ACHHY|nr:hypothetical protein ACHHYP_17445 [Achlya hypogyna]